jgi:hypothetical protein
MSRSRAHLAESRIANGKEPLGNQEATRLSALMKPDYRAIMGGRNLRVSQRFIAERVNEQLRGDWPEREDGD